MLPQLTIKVTVAYVLLDKDVTHLKNRAFPLDPEKDPIRGLKDG